MWSHLLIKCTTIEKSLWIKIWGWSRWWKELRLRCHPVMHTVPFPPRHIFNINWSSPPFSSLSHTSPFSTLLLLHFAISPSFSSPYTFSFSSSTLLLLHFAPHPISWGQSRPNTRDIPRSPRPVLSRQVSIMSSSKSFGFINLPFFSARVKFLPNYRSRTLEAERRTKDKSRDWERGRGEAATKAFIWLKSLLSGIPFIIFNVKNIFVTPMFDCWSSFPPCQWKFDLKKRN